MNFLFFLFRWQKYKDVCISWVVFMGTKLCLVFLYLLKQSIRQTPDIKGDTFSYLALISQAVI